MISVLFGIISALCFGVSNAYWKTASKKIDFPFLVIFRGVFASFVFGLLWFFFVQFDFDYFGTISTSGRGLDYIKTFLLCFVCSLGLIFFLSSLKFQPVSISVPLTSINIFNILTAVFIVGETFHSIYLLSFSIALIGILLSLNFKLESNYHWNKGATYAMLASFFWGITYPLFKFVSPVVGAIPLSFILELCVTISAIIWAFIQNKNINLLNLLTKQHSKHYIILAMLLIGGTLFFNLAIQNLSVLSLNILANLQLVVSLVIGILIYKEHLKHKQLIGIILIFISILLTQYFI